MNMNYCCDTHQFDKCQNTCPLCELDLYKNELIHIKKMFELTLNYNLNLSKFNIETHISRINNLIK